MCSAVPNSQLFPCRGQLGTGCVIQTDHIESAPLRWQRHHRLHANEAGGRFSPGSAAAVGRRGVWGGDRLEARCLVRHRPHGRCYRYNSGARSVPGVSKQALMPELRGGRGETPRCRPDPPESQMGDTVMSCLVACHTAGSSPRRLSRRGSRMRSSFAFSTNAAPQCEELDASPCT
jgi:hypothetical protein